ncbi:MAG TPA: glycosyltransferase family 1 protein [Acetobacteraceae bacterium]|nr:glycosyltransferase family 1 protein [Acetobacteraceae bacterium]
MAAVFLNGRFLSQPVTGVQRFSAEIVAAIDRLVASGEWPDTAVLMPPPARAVLEQTQEPPERRYPYLRLRKIGRTHGHLWEQMELPGAARGRILVSLGNTAPVLAGRRQVVVVHDAGIFDTPESYSLCFRTWYRTLLRGLVYAGAQVVTVSDFSRRRIAAHVDLPVTRIAVVHEGAEHILRVAADPATLPRYGLRLRNYALVVGSRVAHKNLATLSEATALLRQRGMTIAVAGGADRDVFSGDVGAGSAERRLGRVSDAELRALYEGAACLLFPSRYEGFGLPPVEAMACGCPVLAGRGGAVEEICTDHALYFDVTPHSVAGALACLLNEPALAEDLRQRGRAHAARLNWTASARALGAIVRDLQ